MTDFERVSNALTDVGCYFETSKSTEGWGLPKYQNGETNYPPMVQSIVTPGSELYFANATGRFLGVWTTEYSDWQPRRLWTFLGLMEPKKT
jgi:hypothetical protein